MPKFTMIVKADASSEAGTLPDAALLVAIGRYNQSSIAVPDAKQAIRDRPKR